jgi:hypothetical protein
MKVKEGKDGIFDHRFCGAGVACARENRPKR